MTLQTYLSYLDTMRDEMPLYLFDKGFADKAPSLRRDIEVLPFMSQSRQHQWHGKHHDHCFAPQAA